MDFNTLSSSPIDPVPADRIPRVRQVLGVLLMAVLGGSMLGVLIYAWVAYMAGWNYSVTDAAGVLPDMTERAGRDQTRLLLGLNHFCMFVLPGLFTLFIFYNRPGSSMATYVRADTWPSLRLLFQGIGVMLVSLPVVLFTYELNRAIPLPDLLHQMESDTSETLKKLLVMENGVELLANLIVIALLPGIGEELIFRGILQQQLQRRLPAPWMAIALTAVIFSAIHLQFEGFIPRLLLGLLLGWLYWRTQNFWVPATAHFCNNALQVVMQYLYGRQYSTIDLEKDVAVPWQMVAVSVVLTFLIIRQIEQNPR